MAKFQEVFKDTQDLFNKLIDKAGFENYGIHIKVLANNRLKEIGKLVKANDLIKHMTSEDVIVLLNETIFEKLTPEQKTMVAEELLAPISFDTENDKIVIGKPDVKTYSGLLRKYTYAKYEVLLESIKTLFQAEKDKEDAAKATTTPKAKSKAFAK